MTGGDVAAGVVGDVAAGLVGHQRLVCPRAPHVKHLGGPRGPRAGVGAPPAPAANVGAAAAGRTGVAVVVAAADDDEGGVAADEGHTWDEGLKCGCLKTEVVLGYKL